MDLPRFVSILQGRQLHFSQASKMPDKWEGAYGQEVSLEPEFREFLKQYEATKAVFLSCWYVADEESVAMWEVYQKQGVGLAIRSTWGQLKGSLIFDKPIFGGLVEYVDHNKVEQPGTNVLTPFAWKQIFYDHEREARLLIFEKKDDQSIGMAISVDLKILVNEIVVSPGMPDWIVSTIDGLVTAYGFDFAVNRSAIDAVPSS